MITPAGQSPIRIVIGDANEMASGLMVNAFSRRRAFQVVACATSGASLLSALQSVVADVALVHVALRDGPLAGLEAIKQIYERHPNVRSVVMLEQPERNLIVDVFRAGARGVFCSSAAEFNLLCRCVIQVHAGQIWANSSDLVLVMEALTRVVPLCVTNGQGMNLLSKREEDVVRLLVEGRSNRDIAHELQLSEHTIKNYMFKIFDKLGVSSRVEVALYALSSMGGMQAGKLRSDNQLAGTHAETFSTDTHSDLLKREEAF